MNKPSPIELLGTLARQAWRERWVALGVAWAVSVVFILGIALMRDRYQASARVYIDTHTVLKPLMAGLAFQPDLDQQVRMLARTLISRPNIEKLRADPTIGWEPAPPAQVQAEIDSLMKAIRVQSEGGNVYNVSYRDTDAGRATRLVAAFVKTFSSASEGDKRRDSEEARRFIDTEIGAYEQKLAAAENALKDFKLKNFGVTGVPGQDYFVRISALQDEIAKLRLELSAAEQSREALKRELATEPDQLPPEALAAQAPQAPTELETRIEGLRRQLDELMRRYTDEHPDVAATRRSLAQAEAQRRAEIEAKARAAGTKGSAATNPVFQRIRISLAEAEATVASLASRLATQQARLDQVRATASRVPQVEAELAQLNRDYDIIRKNYEALVARRESASLGVKIDEKSSLAEFRLIDPPRAGTMPVLPNRISLAFLGLLVAIAAGLAAAVLRARSRPVVDSLKGLRELSGRPVLGAVSLIPDRSALARRRKLNLALASSLGVLVLSQLTWIGWLAVRMGA